jgi:ketosteroid isomerase-like protein
MAERDVTDVDVDELIEIMTEAAQAFIGGDMPRYYELMHHADDFTLMPPTGGDVSRDTESAPEQIAAMGRFFKRGECTLEVVETYASGNVAVLVAIEHQHGEVGDYPDQDWSLRVTLVFRREESGWRLAHRHADALVHPITFGHLAELARGEHGP